MTFTWTDDEINREQADAVLAPGSVFVVACPGSGKTRTLTYKIAHELGERSKSERRFVVAITYTNRAAEEIRERISDLGLHSSGLWIGTIHAFCLEWILRPYGLYLPELANGYSIIDPHDREDILSRLCRGRGRVTHWDCNFYFDADGYQLASQDHAKHPVIHEVIAEYFEELEATKRIDFELVLWHAYKLIRENPPISTIISRIISILLVDEFQDTKRIQYEILGQVLRAGAGSTRLFMVGDPNQAIFGSLGGYAMRISDLRELTGLEIQVKHLSKNFRSSSKIIQFYNEFALEKDDVEPAGKWRDYASKISYDPVGSRDDLVTSISRLIRHNIEDVGIQPREICVLAPQWLHLAAMTRRLVTALPEYQFDGPGMAPFARDFENFWYKLARIALTKPSPEMYSRRLRWAWEVVGSFRHEGAARSEMSAQQLLRVCNSIDVRQDLGMEYLAEYFAKFCAEISIEVTDYPQLESNQSAFFTDSRLRIASLVDEGLNDVDQTSFFRKVFDGRTGISVSTIHGVKGAEFDVVIAYALLEGMVPHFNDPEGEVSARKLLYVVGSRARKNLHLFSESGRSRGRFGEYLPTNVLFGRRFNYDRI